MSPTELGAINGRWELQLTPDRVAFHAARPEWESKRLAAMWHSVEPGDVVWDIGAESGDFSVLYKQWVGDEGMVCVVEPSPPMWPQLRTHWEANVGPEAPPRAIGFVSDQALPATDPDPAAYTDYGEDGWPGCSVGVVEPDPGFRHLAGQPAMYDQWTIDALFIQKRWPAPDHVVLDIEGAEWHALAGARAVLEECRPTMWVSIHPLTLDEWYGKAPVDIHLLMRDAGYDGRFLGLCTEELWLYTPR